MLATFPVSDAPAANAARFDTRIATTDAEIAESQRLRYRVFADELGAHIDDGGSGLDRDGFDDFCRHLLVRDTLTGAVVASTRLLSDDQAARAGGFYSASEFDLEMIHSLPGRVLEVGRTCVDADYRNGAVIATLWGGIARIITSEGFDYLFGCASISLEDGGAHAHAMLDTLRARHLAPLRHHVRPYHVLPRADRAHTGAIRMPPLLKAYVSLGAKACGEPYWDADFACADVFMLLNVSELNPRYARHFLKRSDTAAPRRAVA